MHSVYKKQTIVNSVLAVLTVFLQYNPIFNIKISNAYPLLPLGLVIGISIFSSELEATLYGVIIGIFVDAASASAFGFNTILFTAIAFFVAFISRYLFNNNIRATLVLGFVFSLAYFILKLLFVYNLSTLYEAFDYIVKFAFPSAIYTTVFTVIFFYVEKKINKKPL